MLHDHALSETVCHIIHWLGLAMINLNTKFEVSTFTHYKDMKGNAKCRKWGGLEG